MSIDSQSVESGNWKPSITEVTELLRTLGISPPQSFDADLFPISPPSTWRKSAEFAHDEESDVPEYDSDSDTRINEKFEREKAIEELQIARDEERMIKARNNYFHEYLVEHFKRKQMMHVYMDDTEDDALLNKYLRKLDELERSSEELRRSREEWDAEMTRTRADLRKKKEEARMAVQEMINKERTIGSSTWYWGKPFGMRRVQSLIARQIDRIKDVAKFRIRYTLLRDEFIAKEMELRAITITQPNLTREDYEKLEAEQFYYKRELMEKQKKCEQLLERHSQLRHLIKSTRHEILETLETIENCERTIASIKNSTKRSLKNRQICLSKLLLAKDFIREFDEIVGPSQRSEFTTEMSNLCSEHECWIRKISALLNNIKKLAESLRDLGKILILHGKSLQKSKSSDTERSSSESEVDTN